MAMIMSIASALFLALVPAVAAGDPLEAHPSCDDTKFIGVVSMADDGTIRMHLRSMVATAIVESDLLYKPGDSDYDSIVSHLGGLAPGQSKSVRPWC